MRQYIKDHDDIDKTYIESRTSKIAALDYENKNMHKPGLLDSLKSLIK